MAMQEFLNPKSMVTPGIAGGMVMLLANGLCHPFPELQPRYVALGLSFLFGAITFGAGTLKLYRRALYWVLNSLVIFVVGFGAAQFASEPTPPAPAAAAPAVGLSLPSWLLPSAYAQAPAKPEPKPAAPKVEPGKDKKQATQSEKKPFFKKW